MPNYCNFTMKLIGEKKDKEAFIKKMQDYDEPNHFWRIFNVYDAEVGDGYNIIEGDCAWSIESCCRASGYSGGVDLLAVNTKDLNLKVEIYTSEPGMGFEEHYIYDHGECIADECVDMTEWWWPMYDQTFEEFKEDSSTLPNDVTEEDFDDEGYYRAGGFGDISWNI